MEKLSPNTIIEDGGHSYTLLEYIGSGSYGEVWKARNDATGEDVAIKFYIMLDDKGREEFMSEYEIASDLQHKNLLTASYIGTWENRPFLVMRYCPKGSSVKLIGQLEPCEENEKIIWRFIHDVASGLAYLHAVEPDPIVHQDIKPDNILQDTDGSFVITDFGISKKIRSTMRRQSTRAVNAGAVAYMGPERFSSQPAPIMASDVWSLGASIYELAMGELPFCGQGGNMLRNGADMPEVTGWSSDLQNIIHSCLEKEPWERLKAYQIADFAAQKLSGKSMSDPRKTIRKAVAPTPTPSKDDNRKPDKKKKRSSNGWIGIASIAAVLVIFLTFVGTADRRDARAHISEYDRLVAGCQTTVNNIGSSGYSTVEVAIDQINRLKEMEWQYAQYFPEVYDKSSKLSSSLNNERRKASSAWTKAANTQKKLGEKEKALNYYILADKFSGSSANASEIDALAKSMGYMKVKDIQFRNYDNDKELSAYGAPIKASNARWIGARVLYDGLLEDSHSIDITIKIYKPNGQLWGKYASEGYTLRDDKCVVLPGEGKKMTLDGYGNATVSCYEKGTYRYEIWYGKNKLFTKYLKFE